MKIEILRGSDHIGGTIIKVSNDDTAILLDCGAMLPRIGEKHALDDFDISAAGKLDAIFLSHHHGDHSGLIEKLPPTVDLYASHQTITFINELDMFLSRSFRLAHRNIHCLFDGEKVTVGSIDITAYNTEHSAEGALMFKVECGNKVVLYTGDFKRSELCLDHVDLLITEGTMLTRNDQRYSDEDAVEMELRKVLKETRGRVFILASSANLPRIRSITAARDAVCGKTSCDSINGASPRPIMQDVFLKYVLDRTGHKELAAPYAFIWNKFSKHPLKEYDRIAKHYCDIGAAASCRRIASLDRAIVFIRPAMADMLEKLIESGMNMSKDALVFSMWRGYEQDPDTARLLSLFKDHGIAPRYIHTSGHADRKAIGSLIENTNPKMIACVHSEDPRLINGLAHGININTDRVIHI